MTSAEDAWRQWHEQREQALAADFGWLTLSSYQWLPEEPSPVEEVAGLWSSGAGGVQLTAVAADNLVMNDDGTPVDGTVSVSPREGDSVFWVRQLPGAGAPAEILVEVGRRGGRYMIRTRRAAHPGQAAFRVPTFPYHGKWVITGTFTPYEQPRTEQIGSYRRDTRLTATAVGEVSFELHGRMHSLVAEAGEKGALYVNFHDLTNHQTTAAWRFLNIPTPAPDGSVVLDFNRTLNYPFAFSEYAVCPAPMQVNRLELAVTAGEKKPHPAPAAAGGAQAATGSSSGGASAAAG